VIDGAVCITMNVVREFEEVTASLAQIHLAYPDARIVLLADNADPILFRRWTSYADSRTQVIQTPGIYDIARGGHVVNEHLRAFLATDAGLWFKMDPDTLVRRRLTATPNGTCFFGTVQLGLPRPSLQGGCIAARRAAVAELYESGVLGREELTQFERTWAEGNGVLLRRARERGLVSFDFIHAWACEHIGMPLVDHADIKSHWLRPPLRGERFAITHPHKNFYAATANTQTESEVSARVSTLQALLMTTLPPRCIAAMIGEPDGPEMALEERTIWPFPLRANGAYVGTHPRDSSEAIQHIQVARQLGVQFLVVPASSRWWITDYRAFGKYLTRNSEVVFWQDDLALLFDLDRPSLNGPHANWCR
jgi:hypothetical protein